MKYETYKNLSPEAKEEWNLKYKDLSYPVISKDWMLSYVAMILTIILIAFSISNNLLDPEKYKMLEYISMFGKVNQIMLIVFCVDYLGQTIYFIYKKIEEGKFIRRNKNG